MQIISLFNKYYSYNELIELFLLLGINLQKNFLIENNSRIDS